MQPDPDPDSDSDSLPQDPDTVLWCNCKHLCDGKMQIIKGRRKWNRHAKHREGPAEFFKRRRGEVPVVPGSSASRAPAPSAQVRHSCHDSGVVILNVLSGVCSCRSRRTRTP